MKKNLMFLVLAAIGLASCNGGYKKGEGGFLYNFYTSNSGPKVKEGDFLLVNVILKNDADSVLMSTYDQGRPAPGPAGRCVATCATCRRSSRTARCTSRSPRSARTRAPTTRPASWPRMSSGTPWNPGSTSRARCRRRTRVSGGSSHPSRS